MHYIIGMGWNSLLKDSFVVQFFVHVQVYKILGTMADNIEALLEEWLATVIQH